MKKYIGVIKWILVILVLIVSLYFGYLALNKYQINKQWKESLVELPNFELNTLTGERFTKDDFNLLKKESSIFIYFKTECPTCQEDVYHLSQNLDLLKDITLVLVASESIEEIQGFAENYGLENELNFIFLQDKSRAFSNRFQVKKVPTLFAYNSNNKLQDIHVGAFSVLELLEIINP